MESTVNILIEVLICLGRVSLIMLLIFCILWTLICLLWILEKLDDKYHWYNKLFNEDEHETK